MDRRFDDFFTAYANALVAGDIETAEKCFHLPSFIMADDDKLLLNDDDSLRDHLVKVHATYKEIEVAQFLPRITRIMPVSSGMIFVHVYWTFYKKGQTKLFACDTSYTIEDKESLNIVAIMENDERCEIAKLR